jgi:hypothetical protein
LARQQTHPEDYHRQWRIRHKLRGADWGMVQHQLAMRCVAVGACSDQLDLSNLTMAEALLKEAQMAEPFYKNTERDAVQKARKDKKAGGPPLDEAELFAGP